MSPENPGDFPPMGDPFEKFFAGQDLGSIMNEMRDMFEAHEGPVNLKRARTVALDSVKSDDPEPSPSEQSAVADAFALADQWLDSATDLPRVAVNARAWTKAAWVDSTIEQWCALIGPITIRTNRSLEAVMPEEMRQHAQPVIHMINQISGSLVAQQIGHGIGTLAPEVMNSTDIGIPMAQKHVAAILPRHVRSFAEELEIPTVDAFVYFAMRELVHIRLFEHAPWLLQRIESGMADISEATVPDYTQIENLATTDPQAMLNFALEDYLTDESKIARDAALDRLETLLALIEGWVDDVIQQAAADKLGALGRITEAMRRRRAAGGPAEDAFSAMVGLEFRPRRLIEAARLWSTIRGTKGQSARDAVWSHPDLLPGTEDLSDPLGFGEKDDLDDQIAQLLDENQRPNE